MTAVPIPKTWALNEVVTAADVSAYISSVLTFLLNKPMAELRQAVAQSIPNGTWTSLTFTVEDLDDDPAGTGGHSTSVNTSRFTAVYPGWYMLGGGYNPVVNATGIRGTRWAVNGTAATASNTVQPATAAVGAGYAARVKRVYLDTGDYAELQGYQDSTGALSTTVTGDSASSMSPAWDRLAA